jgi:hypothetical protein
VFFVVGMPDWLRLNQVAVAATEEVDTVGPSTDRWI